jgi:hypothetical protein
MKVTLTIPLLNGKTWKVDVTVVGDLAIHRSHKEEGLWSVTHIPTLLTLNAVVPNEARTEKKKLMAWATLVQEGVKKDWLALRKVTAEEIKKDPDRTKGVRDRIRKHCEEQNA